VRSYNLSGEGSTLYFAEVALFTFTTWSLSRPSFR
jgi:hypothetical protein